MCFESLNFRTKNRLLAGYASPKSSVKADDRKRKTSQVSNVVQQSSKQSDFKSCYWLLENMKGQ